MGAKKRTRRTRIREHDHRSPASASPSASGATPLTPTSIERISRSVEDHRDRWQPTAAMLPARLPQLVRCTQSGELDLLLLGRLAQLAQGPGLDLPDPLLGHAQLGADLLRASAAPGRGCRPKRRMMIFCSRSSRRSRILSTWASRCDLGRLLLELVASGRPRSR